MHILIIGAAGMIGRKLTQHLASTREFAGFDIEKLTLADIAKPERPEYFSGELEIVVSDLAKEKGAARLISKKPDIIFHLAAVVSGEAEANFEKGYRVNLDGTRNLFEAIRKRSPRRWCPRLIFASSIAVFGSPFPEAIDDEFLAAPLTSYGTQKAMCELLLSDYSRRGFFDGVGIRLPTICVRPGAPNKAASGFFSAILREPLAGKEALLPVGEDVRHWHASPRAAVAFLVHAANMDLGPLGTRRNLTMPGLSATVGEQIEALRRVAGDAAVKRIRRVPDPVVAAIVAGWPRAFDARRALALGFRAETSFDEIIRIHIEDELGGRIAS